MQIDAYFIIAVVLFALAACSLVASAIIFFRAGVPDAIRFLQHKPMKSAKTTKTSQRRLRTAAKKNEGSAKTGEGKRAKNVVSRGRDEETLDLKDKRTKPTIDIVGDSASESETTELVETSERPTGLLGAETESPTDVLHAEGSQFDSECPTGLLASNATGESAARSKGAPDGSIRQEDSERPTGLLTCEDDPDGANAREEGDESDLTGIAQQEETTFRFILRQNEIVVHTQETIA